MLRDSNVGANSIFWIACGAHLRLAVITGALAWHLGRDRITATSPINTRHRQRSNLDELTPATPIRKRARVATDDANDKSGAQANCRARRVDGALVRFG